MTSVQCSLSTNADLKSANNSDKPKPVKPRRKRGSSGSEPTVTPNGVIAKKLPVIGPPVAFDDVQLKVAFSMLDTNQDGMVNSDELRDMLSRLGFKDVINDTLITSLINDANRNGDDLITEAQFLDWMPKLGLSSEAIKSATTPVDSSTATTKNGHHATQADGKAEKPVDEDTEKDLRAAFAVFDADHNGFITREELTEAMKLMGESLTEADLDKLLNDSDTDKDGQINYEEFIRMLL